MKSATRKFRHVIRWAPTDLVTDCNGTSTRSNRRRVIRKRLLLYTIVAALAVVFIQVSPAIRDEPPKEPQHIKKSEVQEPVKTETPKQQPIEDVAVTETPAPQPEVKTVAETTQSTPVAPVTCEQGIRQVWPAYLQEGAIIVSQHENRRQDPAAIGAINPDSHGSRDYGCFQINDYWHPAYFAEGDWKDPVWAAKYALKIYEGRQRTEGNGWRAWYAVKGVLW